MYGWREFGLMLRACVSCLDDMALFPAPFSCLRVLIWYFWIFIIVGVMGYKDSGICLAAIDESIRVEMVMILIYHRLYGSFFWGSLN